ncbi:MAG TPA: histidine kinase [Blastocatellia bacterium]|nr:histidine kinase [Blastocatellia bacterium]
MLKSLPPRMLNVYFASAALGFSVGLVLSLLLLGLLRRRSYNGSGARARFFLVATALSWNLGGLLRALLFIFGASNWRLLVLIASVLHFSSAAFFPPAFLALWRKPSGENSARAKASRYVCRVSTASALVLTTCFVGFMLFSHIPKPGMAALIERPWGVFLAWDVAITMGLGALLLLPGRLNDFVSRSFAATTLAGSSAHAAMSLIPAAWALSPSLLLALFFVKDQAPLLILLGAIVFFADFRFANLYVKRSLQLQTAVLLAAAFCLLMIGPLPRLAAGLTVYPTAGLVAAATIILVFLLWIFLWISPILDRIVDCRLFREPDYSTAARQLWDELNHRNEGEDGAADQAGEILQTVSRFVRQTLELEDVLVVPDPGARTDHLEPGLSSGEVCQLTCDDPVKSRLGPNIEFLTAVRVRGKPIYLLAITPGARRRQLLESELRFLRAVAGQASSRLETIESEKETSARQSKEERLRRQVSEAELRALRAQINPHFLFNSLNTVADLIVTDPVRAERMTVQLAKVFRHVLSSSDRQMITVNEELDFLRTYLDIEAVRFGDRMRVEFDLDPEVAAETVPSLILQPVVENALKHGLARKVGNGTLQIIVGREEGFLRLTVEDDGPGFSQRPAPIPAGNQATQSSRAPGPKHSGNGVGLRNISERLATIYSGRAKVLFEHRTGGGSRVTLVLPSLASSPL